MVDVRTLIKNDELIEQQIQPAFSKYNKEHFITVNLDGKSVFLL
jgi:hypothetical protein